MDYMTLKEAAEKWGVTPRRVNYYCGMDKWYYCFPILGFITLLSTVWLIATDRKSTRLNSSH